MPTLESLLRDPWRVEPSVSAGVALLSALYLWAVFNRRRFGEMGPVHWGQVALFLGALLTILVALAPVVDELADRYSFTVHMLQHMALSLVMPPLLLLGTPAWLLRPLTRWPLTNGLGHALTRPLVAFALFNAYFTVLHFPIFYDLMLNERPVHIASHLIIMVTSVIMWWPILGPLPEWPRLGYGAQLLYLGALGIPMFVVGAIIALAPTVLYQTYLRAPRIGPWTPIEDQQLAGLLMWMGGLTYAFAVLTVVFFRWAAREEAEARGETPAPFA